MPPRVTLTGRGRVLLAGTRPPSAATADRWLIRLRWLAVMGMLSTTLIARHLVPALPVASLLAAVGGIAVVNVFWMLWIRRAPAQVAAQIFGDVLGLGVVLWLSGGVGNPFAVFLTFQIVLAGLLCTAPVTLGVSGLTLIVVAILAFAPPLSLASSPLGAERVRHAADIMSVATLSAFSGFFVFIFLQRLQELRTASARNEKLAILGRLVGGMSHELNTPLSTILVASRELVAIAADPEAAELARTIADEAQRAADLIGLLRGHVRPGQHREVVDLRAFVRGQAVRDLDHLGFAGERLLPQGAELPQLVLEAGVGHILKNLLTNAVEALGERPGRIEISVEAGSEVIEIAVRDDGSGIPAEVLEHLGEPFETTKAARGGTGLGLYVCTTLAAQMGGQLRIESLGGSGTRATLTLPRADVSHS
jgi:two-component system sensor histidine kinase RegB